MRILKIGDKDYKLEYTIEASLYDECTEKVTEMMFSLAEAQGKESIKEFVHSMKNIPQTTLTMFYAGLLEHHGEDGDGTVLTKKDAKKLIKQYFEEHADDDTGNFYGIMGILMEQMGEDGFFKQIGLQQMNQTEKEPKQPQDHKKKTAKPTEK